MFDFHDQTVIVTGAAGNLGQAVAQAFYGAGGRVALVDRKPGRLPAMYPEWADDARVFFVTGVNLEEPEQAAQMAARVADHFGGIDVLVNTVGTFRGGTATHETPVEVWDLLQAVNARTAFLVSRAVVPYMLARGHGKIVHVAARAALRGARGMAAYSASKAAVIRLTEALAAELRDHNINVNCVLPGTIDTPQNRATMPDADVSRWVSPAAIADVILFLASPQARAIHGAAIPVYGRS